MVIEGQQVTQLLFREHKIDCLNPLMMLGLVLFQRITTILQEIYHQCLLNNNLCFHLVNSNFKNHPTKITKTGMFKVSYKFLIKLLIWNMTICKRLITMIISSKWELCVDLKQLLKEGLQFKHKKFFVKVVQPILKSG